jgi:cell division protease FtsH
MVLIAVVVVVVQVITADSNSGEEVLFSDFRDAVEAGSVESIIVHGDGRIEGTFTEVGAEEFSSDGVREFETVGRVSDDLQDVMLAQGIDFTFKRNEPSIWQPILSLGLPLLLVVLIFFFFMRQLQAGSGKAMSFGKSKARLLNESQNKVTFDDVAGVEEAKEELQEIIEFLRDPKKFTRLGGRIPKGVLLMGPPGTGKTLLAKGIAGEAGVPFFTISGSDFVEMFVGVGASRVRDLFEQGKKNAPCIIFIDEIDAVGRHRGAGMGGGHDEREQTLNQLLVEMDGFESNEGVILIAATNRPDVLDPALLRPGRFDRRVVVPRPDVAGRERILEVHTRKTPLAPNIRLETIAKGTPGFSGADLENLVNEAALIAARNEKDRIEQSDFEQAKDKVLMGAERKSAIVSDHDRMVTAYHEAGHALVAALIPQGRDVDPVHKVTIIPRGRALGVTMQLPEEDRLNATREWAENKIAISMGGRAAEELIFKQITSGASQDLEHATDLARKMVCEWGMSPRLGPVNYGGGGEDDPFLGRDYATGGRGYSEQTAVEIDEEIRNVIQREYDRAMTTLRDNIELLRESAEMLLEFEVLEGEELKMILRGEGDKVRWRRRHQESNQNQPRPPRKDFVPEEDEEDESSGSVVSNTWKPAPAGGGSGDS